MLWERNDYVENNWRRKRNPPEIYFRQYEGHKFILNKDGKVLGDIKNNVFRYPYEKSISNMDLSHPYTKYDRVDGKYYMYEAEKLYKKGKNPYFFFKEDESF